MSENQNLKNIGLERAVVGSILKYGKSSYIDISDVISSKDLTLPINQVILTCVENLAEESSCESFDKEAIIAKAQELNLHSIIDTKPGHDYLDVVKESVFDESRVRSFAVNLKKLAVCRDIYSNYCEAKAYLESLTGNEKLSEVLEKIETTTTDYLNGLDTFNSASDIGEGIVEYVTELLDKEPVSSVGIATGYSIWDQSLGGGLRAGCTVVSARSKTGKSFFAGNVAINVAKKNIPVLLLDSEMVKSDQQPRLLSIYSECPMHLIETGKAGLREDMKENLIAKAKEFKSLRVKYQNTAGMSPQEILNIMRRWITKEVGFNENGYANKCLIIYDYLKLTSGDGLSSFTPEHILLGLIMTNLNNFAIKYQVPILTFTQSNRDGISTEDTSVVSGSDRILWLSSSLTLFKNKDQTDEELGCGFEHGNKKLVVLETRHGPGINGGDYINLHASLRPNVQVAQATGKITEGELYSQVLKDAEAATR